MPVRQSADFFLGGKAYQLARGAYRGRAWQRTGSPDTPGRRSDADVKYGVLPDTLDHPEVWDDWSGGFGQAYRRQGENTYNWAHDLEPRFSRQLMHCRELQGVGLVWNAVGFLDVPPLPAAEQGRIGAGACLMLGSGAYHYLTPVGSAIYQTTCSWGVAFEHRPAIFGSFVYMPVAGGSPFLRANFLGSMQADTHTMPAKAFCVAGGRLWRLHGPGSKGLYLQSVAAGADPASASNWSATLNVLQPSTPGADLIALEDQVCVGAPDGLFVGDHSGTFYNVLADLQFARHPDNGRDLCVYEGRVVYPHQAGVLTVGLGDVKAQVEDITPGLASNPGPVHGKVRCVRNVGPWLMAGLWTGTASYTLLGRRGSSAGRLTWHTHKRLNFEKIDRIHHDSITVASGGAAQVPNRVWMSAAIDSPFTQTWGIHDLLWESIPTAFGNPLADQEVTLPGWYDNHGRIDLGTVDWGAPGTPKVFRAVEIWADNLAVGKRYCNVYYTVDAGSRNLLGRATKSPKDTLYFPSGEGSWVTGQGLALSLESIIEMEHQATSPIYRAIVLRGALRPKSIDQVTAVVRIADGLRDRRGSPMRPGAVQLQELRDLAVSGSPVQLVDLAGATSWVVVQAPVEEQELYQAGDEEPEIAATVRLSVLSFSGV